MAKDQEQNQNSVNIPGGLNTDSSLVNQPQGTTRFVMTGVNETKEGDLGFIANEESNQECYQLPTEAGTPYVPIGKVYIGDENNLIFLVHPSGISAWAILDKECNLTIIVTDKDQYEKFGFSVTQQIDATFRLRRGCERSVYWIDPKPRMFIIDKEEEFKVDDPLAPVNDPNAPSFGDWDISKFGLFKTYKSIPSVNNIEVIDGGGVLPPGSYNFSIRYLDADFNPTEFVTSTETIMIYNSPSTTQYRDIEGTTKEDQPYYNYPDSNKAIKIVLDSSTLDITFPFYQYAITEANAGGGLISDTKFTAEISTRQPTFYYTGTNYETSGSQEEVTMFNNIIERAESIEQIENRLVLGNIKGKEINFCNLQRYASKITADMITKEVFVSEPDSGNSKDPVAHFHGIGYMPGEIYSFGIVYIFKDNSTSPVFHIPGKNPDVPLNTMFSTGLNVLPMSNVNNKCESTRYIDNNTCGQDTFWGVDHEGDPLTDQLVRHHRFPLRTDYNIPFVEKLVGTTAIENVKSLSIKVTKANANYPTLCDPDDTSCDPNTEQLADFGDQGTGGPGTTDYGAAFQVVLNYTEDGIANSLTSFLDPYVYVGTVGDPVVSGPIQYSFFTGNIFANIIDPTTLTISEVFESTSALVPPGALVTLTYGLDPNGIPTWIGTSGDTGLTYTIKLGNAPAGQNNVLYKSTVLGIKFSNIALPSISDTAGQEVTGYYIVRNERKQSDKSILDSAVLLPTTKEKNFTAQGLIFPQYNQTTTADSRVKKDVLGFISPEHKFDNVQYSVFTEIIQQGEFKKEDTIKSRIKINDVAPGTGKQRGHKSGEGDNDGFTLHVKTRDTFPKFIPKTDFRFSFADIKEIFYLDALQDRTMIDSTNRSYNAFNLACDNKIGLFSLKNVYTFDCLRALPYVYFTRNIAEPYSNFRLEPYYKESKNPERFDILTGMSTTEIFNGDTYISAIKYTNSIFFDTRMKKRAGKRSVLGIILGAVIVIASVLVAIFSLGTLTPLAAVGVAAGLSLAVGVGTSLVLSGIKQEAWTRAYNVEYDRGLRITITDDYLLSDLDPNIVCPDCDRGNKKNPSDDEIQWLGDAVNLWFESTINMGLRHSFNDGTPSYVKAPAIIEQGTTYPEEDREYFGIHSVKSADWDVAGENRDEDVSPTTSLDTHMYTKLTYLDVEKLSSRSYIGIATGEIYLINPDYRRRNKQKAYFHLGLEYDCCTDCIETFPHRFHWSEQAFQEELTDNFRMFLPNNYKDLEAETGKITDIYRIGNNLYIHTEEGLWHCPQTFQERVTGDIISFIGTGEYFSIPPRKIVDDANSSSGNKHKWARTKTKYGVLFPSWKEKKWYLFNGETLQPISDNGNANYFKTNMNSVIEQQYYAANQSEYPYINNPSNPIGVGFLSTYDTNKERLIVTKKDMKIMNLPTTTPYEICTDGSNTVVFTNMAQTIADRAANGWTYIGIEDCQMKFVKTIEETTTVPVNQLVNIPNDIDIYVFYDTSGSFGFRKDGTGPITQEEITADVSTNLYFPLIDASLTDWINNDLEPSGWVGQLYRYYDSSERWLTFASAIPLANRNKVLLISLTNESYNDYHVGAINFTDQPKADYITDYNAFTGVGGVYSTYNQFIGINYSICTNYGNGLEPKAFVLHSLAAVKGTNYTLEEVNALPQNLFFSTAEWTTLKSLLQTNPYSTLLDPNGDPGLEQWGWFVKADRSVEGSLATDDCEATNTPGAQVIISPCQFAIDMNAILASLEEVQEIGVEYINTVNIYEYEQGTVFVPEIANTGWTMSYSLKKQEWVGWHPYIPSFYMHVQEKFYSWPQGSRYLHKHNRPNHYQTFYGIHYPFIIEYVDNPSPIVTKLWDYILFQTEAKKFDPTSEEYFDQREVTFNKALFYNTEQTSGILQLQPKLNSSLNYLLEQTTNNNFGVKTIDRNERDWTMNDLRNIRDNYSVPMFIKDPLQFQNFYYIDKIVNPAAINQNLDWTQQESFRDKFLVVRLIFDTFADTRLIFNFSALDKKQSER
jgi:hypothetical protein